MEKGKKMGFVHVKVGIANIMSNKFTYYTGLIDTGATKPVLPARIAKELGIEKEQATRVMTGNGVVIMHEAEARLEIEGNATVCPILISDYMEKIVIGVIALESLGLSVNPKNGTLQKEEFLLYAISTPQQR